MAGGFFEDLAEQSTKAAAGMMEALLTGWLSIQSPDVSTGTCWTPAGTQDLLCDKPVDYLRAYTHWAVAAIAVGAVLVAALRLAWERNGQAAGSFTKGLVTMVVLAGAGVPAVQLLIEIGDAYSTWIVDAAADEDLGKRLQLFAPAALTPNPSWLMVIGISLMMFLTTMVQLLLLLARGAGLILLAGLLPLAAAAGISGSGRAIRDRYLTWLLALVLYKPAAATIYAAVFWLLGKGNDLTTLLTGLAMFCMAIVALPALLRLIAPAVSTLSSGGSGGAGMAAASSVGQVASGALRLSGSSGSGRGGGGGGSTSQRPEGSTSTTPVPTPRPSGGGPGQGGGGGGSTGMGAGGGTSAGSGGAATKAGTGAAVSAGGGAATTGAGAGAGAGAGSAAAAGAGPWGVAAAGAWMAVKAGPAAVGKVGGTASGAVDGEGS
ncbi:hypothetical protein [Micromonospora sp. SH-82]|uniref:hypothetical protein n=1 Tax=Micromonospora sp. SH-82 TaxID=3132938 RepID=UPI003EB9E659